jgi:FAD/FMN-containing dehydrogenase
MKKAYLKELQSKLLGSITDNAEVLDYFSTDGSMFQITPSAVVYPANTADVRKTVEFVADMAATGKPVSLIPRGLGSDLGGGAIGEGMQLVFPAHMNKLLKLDHDSVTVQPGITYKTLQQTLHTHGRFLPPYPSSIDYSTVGGAVANNAAGEKSVKYGSTRDFVKGLKVVLSDGTSIQTHRLSGRELNRKKGLLTLEGEIYRKVDSLILDHPEVIKKHQPHTTRNAAGYALDKVRGKDGSFDLSQIFIGSGGTLGAITEITLKIMPYNPRTTLVVGYLDTQEHLTAIVDKLRHLGASSIEMVDGGLIDYVRATRPMDLVDLLPEVTPRATLLIEFDDYSQLTQKVRSNRAARLISRHGGTTRVTSDPLDQVALWKIRRSTAAIAWMSNETKPALAFIEDAIVPPDKLGSFLDKTYKLFRKHDLDVAVWGSAGDANLHLLPRLDLTKKKDTDKLLVLNREFYEMVIALGGSTTASYGDGLFRAAQLKNLYGEEMFELFAGVKHIFDPQDIFNPKKKVQATEEYAHEHLRAEHVGPTRFDYMMYL